MFAFTCSIVRAYACVCVLQNWCICDSIFCVYFNRVWRAIKKNHIFYYYEEQCKPTKFILTINNKLCRLPWSPIILNQWNHSSSPTNNKNRIAANVFAFNFLFSHWLRNSEALITLAIGHFDRRNFPKN